MNIKIISPSSFLSSNLSPAFSLKIFGSKFIARPYFFRFLSPLKIQNYSLTTTKDKRDIFDRIGKDLLRIQRLDDWYRISQKEIFRTEAFHVLKLNGGSLIRSLKEVYPEHNWIPWRFKNGVHHGFWKIKENRTMFFSWLEKELKIEKPEDWYQVDRSKFREMGGKGLLNKYYGGSLIRCLKDAHPEYDWLPWKFKNGVNRGFWKDADNQRKAMDWAGKELKVEKIEDWYQVKISQVAKLVGKTFLFEIYHESLILALRSIYPEYDWLPWKFENGVNRGFWGDVENQRKFMNWAGKQLKIEKMEDWSRIEPKTLCELGGKTLIRHYYENSIYRLLTTIYEGQDQKEQLQSMKNLFTKKSKRVVLRKI